MVQKSLRFLWIIILLVSSSFLPAEAISPSKASQWRPSMPDISQVTNKLPSIPKTLPSLPSKNDITAAIKRNPKKSIALLLTAPLIAYDFNKIKEKIMMSQVIFHEYLKEKYELALSEAFDKTIKELQIITQPDDKNLTEIKDSANSIFTINPVSKNMNITEAKKILKDQKSIILERIRRFIYPHNEKPIKILYYGFFNENTDLAYTLGIIKEEKKYTGLNFFYIYLYNTYLNKNYKYFESIYKALHSGKINFELMKIIYHYYFKKLPLLPVRISLYILYHTTGRLYKKLNRYYGKAFKYTY